MTDMHREEVWNHLANEAKRRLSYDPTTGVMVWIAPRCKRFIGQEAGYVNKQGYLSIKIQEHLIQGHRVAWLLHHGEWPKYDIDHINGIRTDNRIENLRDVPRRVNRENLRRPMPKNKCGFLGVTKNIHSRRWAAKITVSGEVISLGSFDTPELAHAAYLEAKRSLHEGCSI